MEDLRDESFSLSDITEDSETMDQDPVAMHQPARSCTGSSLHPSSSTQIAARYVEPACDCAMPIARRSISSHISRPGMY
jgi:hypothetical protein